MLESAVIARRDGALWTSIEGHVVLLSVEGGRYFGTNAIGGVIWTFLEQPRSMSELVEHVVAQFRVDRDQCVRDVEAFVQQLRASQLIVDADATAERNGETTAEPR